MKNRTRFIFVISAFLLVGCTTIPPSNPSNICSIFTEYPSWYKSALQTQQRWGVPVSVLMAIIYQESSFDSSAKPPREKVLGVVPGFRPTSAFGYSQALDDSWRWYKNKMGSSRSNRGSFEDAIDFIGFYANQAQKKAQVPKNDPYKLYLAYHEGIGAYAKGIHTKKKWLLNVANKVQQRAEKYHSQLMECQKNLSD